jgi:hypothetical protein
VTTQKLNSFGLLIFLQPADNRTNTRLLQLPAEIRLQIYSYIIYPSIKCIKIAHGTQTWRVAEKVLRPSIFRASHQLRAEALSYLVNKKPLQICEIEAANAFFRAVGSDVICDIKSLSMAQVFTKTPLPREQIEQFAHFLGQATSLQHFSLETGILVNNEDYEVNFAQNMLLFEKVFTFVKERGDIEFQWASGSANSQLYGCKKWENIFEQIKHLGSDTDREMFRKSVPHGQMYLW